jgi:hypothetical protein
MTLTEDDPDGDQGDDDGPGREEERLFSLEVPDEQPEPEHGARTGEDLDERGDRQEGAHPGDLPAEHHEVALPPEAGSGPAGRESTTSDHASLFSPVSRM